MKRGCELADIIATGQGSLTAGAEAVDDARREINDRIRAVRTEVEELRSYWSGEAATKFGQLGDSWNEKATKLNDILIQLSADLRGTEKDQIAAEDEYKSTISGISSILG